MSARGFVLLAVLVLVAGGALLALIPQPEFPEFVSKEHAFRARFGGEPRVNTDENNPVKPTVYSVERIDGTFEVVVLTAPEPVSPTPEQVSRTLTAVRDEIIQFAGAKQTADAPITLAGKYPGREFAARFELPQPGALRVRVYLVGPRRYQVLVKGTEEFTNGNEATAFLNSFMVVE